MQAEFNRKLENIVRYGVVAEVDHEKRRAKVKTGNILTDWLPWCAWRAGTTQIWSPVTKGEQVILISPAGEINSGFILSALYTFEFDTPSYSPDEHVIQFADNATIQYNQATGELKVRGIKTALIEASTSVTLKTPLVHCTQDVNVDGNVNIKGSVSAQGSATVQGSVNVQGDIQAQGDITAGTVSLKNHTHQGDSGGITGAPNG
ncbi:baseplate assembly protein [Canicola haemoglobinophilus]|uniref:Phage baseplate assembly protein V n=1 Tax=Canicola haemoglobinophilus TaxID=733 RepID=A0A1V4B172_9PAST|nr:phage baseplate assembly protein V [Canicola haemoglobinophilus]OOS00645.1 baseplate assembly protein [Canicola haemoglobinophilus]STO60164.1 phage baseplate assembly protein V [Canicola haemoglobinophilus]